MHIESLNQKVSDLEKELKDTIKQKVIELSKQTNCTTFNLGDGLLHVHLDTEHYEKIQSVHIIDDSIEFMIEFKSDNSYYVFTSLNDLSIGTMHSIINMFDTLKPFNPSLNENITSI